MPPMKKERLFRRFSALCIIGITAAVFVFSGCKKAEAFKENAFDDIENISYSGLKRLEPINIVFKTEVQHPENIEKAFNLRPAVRGVWTLSQPNSVSFTPEEPYDFKKELTLNADIGLLQDNKPNIRGLTKIFSISPPEFTLSFANLIPEEKTENMFRFEAVGETDIPMETETVKKLVSASLEGESGVEDLTVQIEQSAAPNAYKLGIKNIQRKKSFQNLMVKWDLKSLGSDIKGSKSFTVAAESVFQVMSFEKVSYNEIEINFSDALDSFQDLRGLVEVFSQSAVSFRYTIDGHKLKLFSQNGIWADDTKVRIAKGVKNVRGKTLSENAEFSVIVEWDKPEIAFTKTGNIIPSKDNAGILVSTKNLRGLMIEAFQIFDKNMLQFLQTNTLSGYYQLERVGEPVWRQSFDFEWDASMKNKQLVRRLDLTKLVKKFPGGMFELRVSFTKKHSMYESSANAEDFSNLPFPQDITEIDGFVSAESVYWTEAELTEDERDRFWSMRENPNHPAFYLPSYNKGCVAVRSALVSNIGLSVKEDKSGKLYIACADIVSGNPMDGVTVKLFSYAQKELESGKTDSQGLLMLPNKESAAYFVQAEKGGLYNWIRVGGDSPLSTSHFDVDGQSSEAGVKGYIYGERGVWRPGDDIHLVFILQDSEKTLPKDYPVKFTLEDPLGKKNDYKVFTSSVDGFYRIDTKTGENAKTGTWSAKVTVGGKTWTKSVKVETIIPNRLFIDLKPKKGYFSAGGNPVTLSGEWLHGAKASGLKAQIAARFIPDKSPFEKYKNYNFINPERQVKSEQSEIWSGNLNADGKAELNLDFGTKFSDFETGSNAPGKLKAVFETRIYEPSGVFSSENKIFSYSPYGRYVGMEIPKSDDIYRDMLYTDREQNLHFVLLDAEGNPVKGKADITVKLYKLEWFWWWETDYEETNYTSARNTRFIKSWDITAQNGAANLKLKIDDGDWGRYLIAAYDEKGGHSSAQVVYFDWAGWASRKTNDEDSAAMLTVTAGKTKYYADETAEITFPCYEGARALVTVEKDGHVLKQEWIKTAGTICAYKLKLEPSMAPNVYVHVSLIQEHMQTKNSLPIRMYGISPVMIENKNSRISPVIKAAEAFEPNAKASFIISEEKGRAMTCTVAVVDEGLLGLTAFSQADPWNSFYRKESSQIRSWDIYNYVIGAYGGKIESLLAVGGGSDIEKSGSKNAERFKPVVFFFGPYELKAGEKKQIEFDMPQYIGAVRIMTVAGKDGAYGVAEQSVRVKSDLIVMPTLPRTLGVDETVQVPVTVFNGTASEKTAFVSLKAEGAVKASAEKQVKVAANADASVIFEIKTNKSGIAQFNVEASAGGIAKKAKAFTEIDVLSRGLPFSSAESLTVAQGKSVSKTVPLKGEKGARQLKIEISQFPSLGLENRLQYLLQYPYGCLEQITSKAFPQIYLPDILVLDKTEIEKTKANVISVLDRYAGYQLASGAFSYWPGSYSESSWATNYAGHFMTEAKKAGYEVNSGIYQSWLNYQKEKAANWSSTYIDHIEDQAYRLFTLALAGKPEIGAMNRLKSFEGSLNGISAALLANAYALAGHSKTAAALLEKVPLPSSSYRHTGRNYSSDVRDMALILNACTICGLSDRSAKIIPHLAAISSSDRWLSTQETAWLLLSVAPHYAFDKTKKTEYEIKTETNVIKDTLSGSSRIYEIPVGEELTKKIEIRNTGKTPMHAAITVQGRLAPGEEETSGKNLNLHAVYFDADGNQTVPEALSVGDRFKIELTVRNNTAFDVENIAASLPIPTGWEITNMRLGLSDDEEEEENAGAAFDYQDIRDTHIYTFFALKEYSSKTFKFDGTVTYGGSYYLPAVSAEAMYDSSFKAAVKGKRLDAKQNRL